MILKTEGNSLNKINCDMCILFVLILIGSILAGFLQTANYASAMDTPYLTNNSNSKNNIANITNTSKYTEILKYYDKALAIDPADTTVLDNKGIILTKLGNYTQALQYFDRVLSIDHNNVGGLYNKAIALYRIGKYAEAKIFQNKAQQIDPTYSGEFINKVSIANQLAANKVAKSKSQEGILAKGNP